MSDTNELRQDELSSLKARADLMGISYHPSIGIEKLREKVRAALDSETPKAASTDSTEAPVVKETEAQKRNRLKKEASKLVRIRLTCMNPAKAEWDGEIITVGNTAVGSFKKFIPFNGADEGWHVPHIMYEALKDRQCQIFTTTTDSRGNKIRRGKLIKEFNIEVLPTLTPAELKDMAQRQAMAAGSVE